MEILSIVLEVIALLLTAFSIGYAVGNNQSQKK